MRLGHAVILAACLLYAPPTWAAEVPCAPLASIAKALAQTYHEAPIAHAIADTGVMLIVFGAANGATWTLVGVRPNHPDVGCWLGAGTDWTSKAPVPGKPS